MAKADKKAKKPGAGKIPKRIAGVKLPKEVRRKGEALLAKAQSPAGRDAIAAGLTMVAAVAATTLRKKADAAGSTTLRAGAGASSGVGQSGGGGTTRAPDFEALAATAVGALQTWLAGKKAG